MRSLTRCATTAPIISIAFLCGCTAIDIKHPIEGWPAMREEVHLVSSAEMHKVCDKYGSALEFTLSCAEIFWNPDVCKIWITERGGWIEEHEHMHCKGYAHFGDESMKQMLKLRKGT